MLWAFASIAVCTVISAMGISHDFHFSRTDVRWNPESHTLQTTLRVFTDDLELAMKNHGELEEGFVLWLGEEREWAESDATLLDWSRAHLQVWVDSVPVTWQWVGKEVELDVSYLYLESQPLDAGPKLWQVTHSGMFKEYADQVNEVQLQGTTLSGKPCDRREMLSFGEPELVWTCKHSK